MDEVKSMERKCSVCKQTRTSPRYGFPGATCASLGIKFKTATCKLCGTSSVCMDCLHERECCESKAADWQCAARALIERDQLIADNKALLQPGGYEYLSGERDRLQREADRARNAAELIAKERDRLAGEVERLKLSWISVCTERDIAMSEVETLNRFRKDDKQVSEQQAARIAELERLLEKAKRPCSPVQWKIVLDEIDAALAGRKEPK